MVTRRHNTTTYPREKKSYLGKAGDQHPLLPERVGDGGGHADVGDNGGHADTASPLTQGHSARSCWSRGGPGDTQSG